MVAVAPTTTIDFPKIPFTYVVNQLSRIPRIDSVVSHAPTNHSSDPFLYVQQGRWAYAKIATGALRFGKFPIYVYIVTGAARWVSLNSIGRGETEVCPQGRLD